MKPARLLVIPVDSQKGNYYRSRQRVKRQALVYKASVQGRLGWQGPSWDERFIPMRDDSVRRTYCYLWCLYYVVWDFTFLLVLWSPLRHAMTSSRKTNTCLLTLSTSSSPLCMTLSVVLAALLERSLQRRFHCSCLCVRHLHMKLKGKPFSNQECCMISF